MSGTPASHAGARPSPAGGQAGDVLGGTGSGDVPDLLAAGGEITPEFAAALIQRIFGAGLLIAGVSSMVGRGPAAERLALAVEELDLLVREVRQAVFARTERLGFTPGPW